MEAPADETDGESIEDACHAEEEGGKADGIGEAAFAQKGESGDGGDEKGREENEVVILEAESPIDEAADKGG